MEEARSKRTNHIICSGLCSDSSDRRRSKGSSKRVSDSPTEAQNCAYLGGKGARLVQLAQAGLPVPPFIVVTTKVFESIAQSIGEDLNALQEELLKIDPKAAGAKPLITKLSKRAEELILVTGIKREDIQELLFEFDRFLGNDSLVAVRSSVVGEDSGNASFAGQMDTYLFVRREDLVERVVNCFASAFSERALLYRLLRATAVGENPRFYNKRPSVSQPFSSTQAIEAAIVIQKMIDSRTAGVAFTANPLNGNRDEVLVTAGFGLGEGVVSSLIEADTYYVDKNTLSIKSMDIRNKTQRVVFAKEVGSGTTLENVSDQDSESSALTRKEILSVARLAIDIESSSGLPQDIEWAYDKNGRLFLLQARPITSLSSAKVTIFDNSNIVESYPGLSSPLTFSFVRRAYEVTFSEALRLLGVLPQEIDKEKAVLENLVGMVHGRIYYNILNWYFIFQFLGLEKALPTFEKTLGIDACFRAPTPSARARLQRLPKDIRIRSYLLGGAVLIDKRARDYLGLLSRVREEIASIDLDGLDAHALVDLFEYCNGELLAPYGVSVVNDLYAQHFHEIILKLLEKWNIGDAEALRNRLMTGETEMQSVEPLRSVLGLVEMIRTDEALLALFEGDMSNDSLWESISKTDAFCSFHSSAIAHLKLYGDRTVNELKLETPTMEDNPGLLIATLRNYLKGGVRAESFDKSLERKKAEKEVRRRLLVHPIKQALFEVVLTKARAGLRNRENLRLARSRAFGIVKRIFRALGRHLAGLGLLNEPPDVFWLTVEEVVGLVRGHSITCEPRRLVELRKEEYQRFASVQPATRVSAYGVVNLALSAQADADIDLPSDTVVDTDLSGIGCCAGIVRAKAKVVCEPTHDIKIDGEILVAPMTDPGWIFLMAAASGLVVERGSLLSHTAIIGRELGVPTVVSVKEATRNIVDGEVIEIDGAAGIVRKVGKEEAI